LERRSVGPERSLAIYKKGILCLDIYAIVADNRCIQLENYYNKGNRDVHGHHGPIHVSASPFNISHFESQFLLAAKQQGYGKINDLQGM
jgi:hypothetical protein